MKSRGDEVFMATTFKIEYQRNLDEHHESQVLMSFSYNHREF
jgi:hypothetical protein